MSPDGSGAGGGAGAATGGGAGAGAGAAFFGAGFFFGAAFFLTTFLGAFLAAFLTAFLAAFLTTFFFAAFLAAFFGLAFPFLAAFFAFLAIARNGLSGFSFQFSLFANAHNFVSCVKVNGSGDSTKQSRYKKFWSGRYRSCCNVHFLDGRRTGFREISNDGNQDMSGTSTRHKLIMRFRLGTPIPSGARYPKSNLSLTTLSNQGS